MRSLMSLSAALILTALTASASAQSAPGQTCDRACLRGVLDAYMDAVFKHDAKAAPLGEGYRSTENAILVAPGDGVWRNATGYGEVQRRFFDTKTGQAAYYGHLIEGGEADIVSLRIKVVDKKVMEAEWTVARKGVQGSPNALGLSETPPLPDAPLPAKQRTSRFLMMSLANGYFQGLQDHDGSLLPAEATCERVENGGRVTFRPRRQGGPGPAGAAPAAAASPGDTVPTQAQIEKSGNCAAEFEGFKNSIQETTLRRFPLIDEEAGVVMGTTIFRRPPTSTNRRNLLTEYFWVRNGKLAGIWAAMYYLPPEAPHTSGWN